MRAPLFVALALVAFGCSSSPPTRTVTGQLSAGSYTLDNPVVLAEAADARVFVSHVSGSGHFTLSLPTDQAYRLTLANSTLHTGVYLAVARINWPLASGGARWAKVGGGAALDLGTVTRRGYGSRGGSVEKSGSGGKDDDDETKEDDHAKCNYDHEDDCDCDHQHHDDDHCDKDDDGDEHDHDCDKNHGCHDGDTGDDHEGEHEGGHACDGGTQPPPPPTMPPPVAGGPGGGNPGGPGSPCMVNANCNPGLACINSVCATPTPQIP
jgi:hypothetical protein